MEGRSAVGVTHSLPVHGEGTHVNDGAAGHGDLRQGLAQDAGKLEGMSCSAAEDDLWLALALQSINDEVSVQGHSVETRLCVEYGPHRLWKEILEEVHSPLLSGVILHVCPGVGGDGGPRSIDADLVAGVLVDR